MKLNKILLIFIVTLLCAGMRSNGKTVDENTARIAGMNFLKAKGVAGANTTNLTTVYTAAGNIKGKTVNSYYVFNVSDGHAFVIVSADDIIRPILAYSDEAGFDMSSMSPSAKDWVDGYRNLISNAIANNVPAKSTTAQDWSNLLAGVSSTKDARTTGVSALLSTIWNQAPFYNDSCPGAGYYQAPTGCVATAMAQVMKFWNWPTVGTGYLTYKCTSYDTTAIPLSADFGNTAYAWDSMPANVISSSAAVAQLMFHAGVSVEMEYGMGESGAWVLEQQSYLPTQCTEYALKTYFHYKRSLTGIVRNGATFNYIDSGYVDSLTESAWTAMLQTELNAGRPIIYQGFGSAGGHCWVCDGWEGSAGLFHFNWGWGGTGPNGYYTVDDLAPPTMGIGGKSGTNLNEDQGVVIGIEPDSFSNTPGNIMLLAHLNSKTSTPMNYATPFSISTKILNSGTTPFSGDFCAQVFDTLNNLVATIQTYTGEPIAAGDSAAYTFGPSVMYAMAPMDYYHIQVLYRPAGTTAWAPVANNGNYINYTTADVNNDTDIVLNANITVTTSLPVISGSSLSLHSMIYNQGTANFSGTIEAVMVNVLTGTSYAVQALPGQTINMNANDSFAFTNSTFTAPDGLYALMIQHQYGDTGSFHTTSSDYYENPVLVFIGKTASLGTTSAAHDVYVFPNPAKDRVTILPQGVNVTAIHLFDMQGRELQKQVQPNGKSAISIPVTDLAAGVYFIRLQTDDGSITRKFIIHQ